MSCITRVCDVGRGCSSFGTVGIMSRSFLDMSLCAGEYVYPCCGVFLYANKAKYGSSFRDFFRMFFATLTADSAFPFPLL